MSEDLFQEPLLQRSWQGMEGQQRRVWQTGSYCCGAAGSGRPKMFFLGAVIGTALALPLVAALIMTVLGNLSYTWAEIELVTTGLALTANLTYAIIVFVHKHNQVHFWRNLELTFFVIVPFTLSSTLAVVAQSMMLNQAIHGYLFHYVPPPADENSPPPSGSPPYAHELSSIAQTLSIVQSVIYLCNVVLQYLNICMHLTGFRGIARHQFVLFLAGGCLGFLMSFNFWMTTIDVQTTWSSGPNMITVDQSLLAGFFAFRFFCFCAYLNMAFLQPIKISDDNSIMFAASSLSGKHSHQQFEDFIFELPSSSRNKRGPKPGPAQ